MSERRICAREGCGTILSAYRPDDDYCSPHAAPKSASAYEALFPSWTRDANCAGMDTDIFDVDLPSNWRMTQPVINAKRFCANCPVWKDCLEYGFRHDLYYAAVVFGGLTGRERMSIANDPDRMEVAEGLRLHQRMIYRLAPPIDDDGEVA